MEKWNRVSLMAEVIWRTICMFGETISSKKSNPLIRSLRHKTAVRLNSLRQLKRSIIMRKKELAECDPVAEAGRILRESAKQVQNG